MIILPHEEEDQPDDGEKEAEHAPAGAALLRLGRRIIGLIVRVIVIRCLVRLLRLLLCLLLRLRVIRLARTAEGAEGAAVFDLFPALFAEHILSSLIKSLQIFMN